MTATAVGRAGRTSPGGADSTKEPSANDLDMVCCLWLEGVLPMRCWGAMGLFVPCLGGLTVAGTELAIEGSRASLETTEHVPEIRSHSKGIARSHWTIDNSQ